VDASDSRPLARALARELRGIMAALAGDELTPEQIANATRLAREIQQGLQAEPRLRWQETDAGFRDATAIEDRNPIRGELNPSAPPLRMETFERPDGGPAVRGRARLGVTYEGPPYGVHGGWVAALFDDLLGAAQAQTVSPGVTAILTVRYRDITPLDQELDFEAWVEQDRGKRIVARATCHAGHKLTAEAEGVFVRVDFDAIQRRMREDRSQKDL